MNDDLGRIYNTNSQINCNTILLKSSLCDFSDEYILVKGTIAITWTGKNDFTREQEQINKQITFEKGALFPHCVNKINKTKVNNAKDLDAVIPMYILKEYRKMHAKILVYDIIT